MSIIQWIFGGGQSQKAYAAKRHHEHSLHISKSMKKRIDNLKNEFDTNDCKRWSNDIKTISLQIDELTKKTRLKYLAYTKKKKHIVSLCDEIERGNLITNELQKEIDEANVANNKIVREYSLFLQLQKQKLKKAQEIHLLANQSQKENSDVKCTINKNTTLLNINRLEARIAKKRNRIQENNISAKKKKNSRKNGWSTNRKN